MGIWHSGHNHHMDNSYAIMIFDGIATYATREETGVGIYTRINERQDSRMRLEEALVTSTKLPLIR